MKLQVIKHFGLLFVILIFAPLAAAQLPQFTETQFHGGPSPKHITIGDVNGDGYEDLVASNTASGSVTVMFGNNHGGFASSNTIPVGPLPQFIMLADLNLDGKPDVVVASALGNFVTALGNGAGNFTINGSYGAGASLTPQHLRAADVNTDGKTDVIMASTSAFSGPIQVFTGDGTGLLSGPILSPGTLLPIDIVPVDLNHDGKIDIVASHITQNAVSWKFGDGAGGFPSNPNNVISNIMKAGDLFIADSNGDGFSDIFVTNAIAGAGKLTRIGGGNGAGFFTPVSVSSGGDLPSGIAGADIDRNGRIDMIVCNLNSDNIAFLLASADGNSYSLAGTTRTGAGPFGIAAVDLDGDGNTDFVTVDYLSFNCSAIINQTPAPPATGEFGTGTAGCNGELGITCNHAPAVGTSGFRIYISNAPAAADGMFIMGDAGDFDGIYDPGMDILLHVSPVSTHIVSLPIASTAAGEATLTMPGIVPPQFAGFVFFAQAEFPWSATAICDPSSTGWSSSRGFYFIIQP
ncbi:MAG: VCBS repeat-containing protein [Planctomycetes bacterium]|nr:VCBS repeat-containing protein [Planctomycetota bacterium]